MILRTGRKVTRNLYLQTGPEPADTDPIVGQVDTGALAEFIVQAVTHMTTSTERKIGPDKWQANAHIFDHIATEILTRPDPPPPAPTAITGEKDVT